MAQRSRGKRACPLAGRLALKAAMQASTQRVEASSRGEEASRKGGEATTNGEEASGRGEEASKKGEEASRRGEESSVEGEESSSFSDEEPLSLKMARKMANVVRPEIKVGMSGEIEMSGEADTRGEISREIKGERQAEPRWEGRREMTFKPSMAPSPTEEEGERPAAKRARREGRGRNSGRTKETSCVTVRLRGEVALSVRKRARAGARDASPPRSKGLVKVEGYPCNGEEWRGTEREREQFAVVRRVTRSATRRDLGAWVRRREG